MDGKKYFYLTIFTFVSFLLCIAPQAFANDSLLYGYSEDECAELDELAYSLSGPGGEFDSFLLTPNTDLLADESDEEKKVRERFNVAKRGNCSFKIEEEEVTNEEGKKEKKEWVVCYPTKTKSCSKKKSCGWSRNMPDKDGNDYRVCRCNKAKRPKLPPEDFGPALNTGTSQHPDGALCTLNELPTLTNPDVTNTPDGITTLIFPNYPDSETIYSMEALASMGGGQVDMLPVFVEIFGISYREGMFPGEREYIVEIPTALLDFYGINALAPQMRTSLRGNEQKSLNPEVMMVD